VCSSDLLEDLPIRNEFQNQNQYWLILQHAYHLQI
jgi:hypothetical protein